MTFIHNNLEVQINNNNTVTLTEVSNRAKNTEHSFDHFGASNEDEFEDVAELVKEWLDDQV